MPTVRRASQTINTNTAKNANTINVKVVVGDTSKKPARKRRSAPKSDESQPPPPPPTVVNYIQPSPQPPAQTNSYPAPSQPRSGASMFNRPYDVADAGVGTEAEAVPEGLASNYEAMEEQRRAVIRNLEQELEAQMTWADVVPDSQPAPAPSVADTDLTLAPSPSPSIANGAQESNLALTPPRWSRNDIYDAPNTTPPYPVSRR